VAYNLTSAAFIPFWGQMSDVLGRYLALQAASVMMLLGSALCAGSPTNAFPMFLAGRGCQGAGSAGLSILIDIILADKVSLHDNARNNTLFAFVAGIGYSIGPTIGGYLTSVSWRWLFILNIPLGLIGLVILHFATRSVLLGPQDVRHTPSDQPDPATQSNTLWERLSTIDYGGQFLFLFGVGLCVLALTWAGSYYPWADVKVIAPLVIGAILVVMFLTWEFLLLPERPLNKRLPFQRAMIPMKLLCSREAGILAYINFITGMAMYSVFYFAALYFVIVREFEPGQTGVSLIFYLPGLAG
jgi:MFS family permease